MKVLFPVEYYPPYTKGGAEISTKLLAEGLSEKGVEVHVLTPNYGSFSDSVSKENDVIIHRFKSLRKFFLENGESFSQEMYKSKKAFFYLLLNKYIMFSGWEFGRKISQLYRKENFDLIHAHNTESIIGLKLADVDCSKVAHIRDFSFFCITGGKLMNGELCKGCSSENIQKCLGTNRILAGLLEKGLEWRREQAEGFDRYVAISEFVSEEIRKEGIPREKTSVVYNPFGEEEVSDLTKEEARKKLGLGYEDIVLFVGALTRSKGAHLLPKLAEKMPDVNLVVLGDGPLRKSIEEGLKNLLFRGKVSHEKVKDYYKASEILIVPSLWHEPFGRVVVEGQLNSTLVIASSVGGIPELIEDGSTGRLVDFRNPKELVESMYDLIKSENKVKRTDGGEEISKKAKKKFDKIRITEAMYEFYRDLA